MSCLRTPAKLSSSAYEGSSALAEQPNNSRFRSRLQIGLSLLAFAILVCLRMPEIVIKGRFWAEEFVVFFRNAWVMRPAEALFNNWGGYLNLVTTTSTLAARWLLPLSVAPYFTIATALVIQLLPPLLLLTAGDAWLQPFHVRLAGILLLLLVPASEEIWLQTLHCQFELTLCCAIILALELASGWVAMLQLGLLFFAPLCGAIAIALLPVFLLRAFIDRSRVRLMQAVALGTGAAIQLLLFFHKTSGREFAIDPIVMLCVVAVRHIAVPFLGISQANLVADAVRASRTAGHVPVWAIVLPIIVFLPLAVATLWHPRSRAAFWFLCAAGVTSATACFGAIGGAAILINTQPGARYAFVPQAVISLAVLTLAATAKGWGVRASWVAVGWLLVIGAWEYAHPWSFISDGPAWRQEVALWHTDHTHVLQVWPDGWRATLEWKKQ